MRMMFLCPHCRTKALIRSSRELSPLLRELMMVCQDAECGHTFVVHAEVARTVSPSAKPDPEVFLPINEKTRDMIAQHSTMTGQIRVPAPQPKPAATVADVGLPRLPGTDHRIHRCR